VKINLWLYTATVFIYS